MEHACEDEDVGGAVSHGHVAFHAILFFNRQIFKTSKISQAIGASSDSDCNDRRRGPTATGFLFAYSFVRGMRDDRQRVEEAACVFFGQTRKEKSKKENDDPSELTPPLLA